MAKYFLSHAQNDTAALARSIYYEGKAKGMTCWLDIMESDKSARGMETGVQNCEVVIAIISPTYFERPFCLQELAWAQKYGKKVQPVHDVNHKKMIGEMMAKALPQFKWIGAINMLPLDTGEMRLFPFALDLIIKDSEALDACPQPSADFDMDQLSAKMSAMKANVDPPMDMVCFRKGEMAFYCHNDWYSFGRMGGWGWKEEGAKFKAWVGGNPPDGTVIITCWRKGEMTYYCHDGWDGYSKMASWGWSLDSYQFHAYPPEAKVTNTVPIILWRNNEMTYLLPKGHQWESKMSGWGWTNERICCHALA